MNQIFDAEHVVEVYRERLSSIAERNLAWKTPLGAPGLNLTKQIGAPFPAEKCDLVLAQAPSRKRQHQPPCRDTRQERSSFERSPVPAEPIGSSLLLQRAQKPINPQAAPLVIMGVGHARDDLAAETR